MWPSFVAALHAKTTLDFMKGSFYFAKKITGIINLDMLDWFLLVKIIELEEKSGQLVIFMQAVFLITRLVPKAAYF